MRVEVEGYATVPSASDEGEPRRGFSPICGKLLFGTAALAILGIAGHKYGSMVASSSPSMSAGPRATELSQLSEQGDVAPERSMIRNLPGLSGRTAQLWQTAQGYGDPHQLLGDLPFGADFDTEGPVLEVDPARRLGQVVEGFGGAFTEASAVVFSRLSPEEQQRVVDTYWGPLGIGYTLGRIHINSCDFSEAPYSFDDIDGDFNLEHFDDGLVHDEKLLIPLVKAAQDALRAQNKRLKLLASPWSPPAWMKTNRGMLHSNAPCLREDAQDTWAKYITRWITAYERHGVDIWAITVQNEPENNATWEACLYTAEEQIAFLANFLGPAMQEVHPSKPIFVFDHNKDHVQQWADAVYSHPQAAQYVAGIAFHWYSGDHFDSIRQIHERYPQAILLPSEATYEKWRWSEGTTLIDGEWGFGEGYAHDIIGNMNAGAVGWIDWNLLLDSQGGPNHVKNSCDAAMMLDEQGQQVMFHPQLSYIGHFSKYVPPKSRHVRVVVSNSRSYQGNSVRDYGTCGNEDGLESIGFLRPDGQIVVVVLNCGDDAVDFKLSDRGEALPGNIPGHAIQTYILARRA